MKEIQLSKNDQKEDLVEKLITGARALDSFFRGLIEGYKPNKLYGVEGIRKNVDKVKNRIYSEFELTPNQRDYFNTIVERVYKASEIVERLKEEYRTPFFWKENDKRKELFRFLMHRDMPCHSEISPICFTMEVTEFSPNGILYGREKSTNGYVESNRSSIEDILEANLEALRNQTEINPKLRFGLLSYIVNIGGFVRPAKWNSKIEMVFDLSGTQMHELKHVIDKYLTCPSEESRLHHIFGEISAPLFGVSSRLSLDYHSSLKKEIEFLEDKSRMSSREESLPFSFEDYVQKDTFLISNLTELISKLLYRNVLRYTKNVIGTCNEILDNYSVYGIGSRDISWIISITNPDKLLHRLNLLKENKKK